MIEGRTVSDILDDLIGELIALPVDIEEECPDVFDLMLELKSRVGNLDTVH